MLCAAGSIIIDPSFVERWLRTHMKSSVAVHSLLVYRKGLLGIKLAAEFMRANASTVTGVDPLRLALKVRTHHQVRSVPLLMMSYYYWIVHDQ
jgi:acetate kinase